MVELTQLSISYSSMVYLFMETIYAWWSELVFHLYRSFTVVDVFTALNNSCSFQRHEVNFL